MLLDITDIVRKLTIDERRIQDDIELTKGLIYRQGVMLALIDELKLPREAVYKIVQDNAMLTAQGEGKFLDLLKKDERLKGVVDDARLASLFEVGFYTRYVDKIFERFGL